MNSDEELSSLQYYTPGILISITIPYRTTNGYSYHINLRQEVLRHIQSQEALISRSQSISSADNITATSSSNLAPVNMEDSLIPAGEIAMKSAVAKPKKVQPLQLLSPTMTSLTSAITKNQRRSRLDDIIEKMERKYMTLGTSNPQFIENEYSDDDIESDDQNPTTNPVPIEVNIDAPELPDINNKPKPTKTKSSKRKRYSEQDFYDLDDDFIDDSEHVEDIETLVRMKYKTKQDGFFVSCGDFEVVEELEDEMLEDDSDEETSDDDTESDGDDQIDKFVRKKPEWAPNVEILSALDRFRQGVLALELKPLSKNAPFPVQINSLLLALDKDVRRLYVKPADVSSALAEYDYLTTKLSGYLEAIVEALGGLISVYKVKRHIHKLNLKEESNALKAELDREVALLKEAIKLGISTAPPPKPIPAPHPEKIPDIVDSEAANKAEIEPGEDSTDNKAGPGGSVEASDNLTPSEMKASSPTTQKPKLVKQKSTSEPIVYKYRCRWNGHMRASLIKIEDDLNKYIDVENKFRSKLTQQEMLDMEDDDVSIKH